jgi:hypothetical protein
MKVQQPEFKDRPKAIIVGSELTQTQLDDIRKACGNGEVIYNPIGNGLVYPKKFNSLVLNRLKNWNVPWIHA